VIRGVCLIALALPALVPAQTRRLNTTQFLVLGEGLGIGVTDYGVRREVQERTFGALIAKAAGSLFPQALFQGPGIAIVPGVPSLPAIYPNTRHTTVREGFPPNLFTFNLSVPGLRLQDSLSRRPVEPLIQPRDPQQTAINLVLGYPALIAGRGKPAWTQAEYAEFMNPTFSIVELGYYEAIDAAASGSVDRMRDPAAFRTDMATLITRLKRNFSEVMVANIPDPFDTGYFTPVEQAPRFVGTPLDSLLRNYGLQRGDFLTPTGLMAIGGQNLSRRLGGLPGGSFVRAAAATAVRARVAATNTEIGNAAQQNNAVLYDLAALVRNLRANGVVISGRHYTADFLGGIYTLNGFYPGTLGHALIANDMIALINRTYGTNLATVALTSAIATDPAGRRSNPFSRRETAVAAE
jgi:hypothetical protein